MKKIFSLLLAASTCSTFSFYKMSEIVLFEGQTKFSPYTRVPNNKPLNPIFYYICYAYNQQIKYGFEFDYDSYEANIRKFKLLKPHVFDRTWWENNFISDKSVRMEFNIFDVSLSKTNPLKKIKNNIYLEADTKLDFVNFIILYLGENVLRLQSGIDIHNNQDGIELSHSKGRTINFEKAFKNYVRKQRSLYDDNLFQHVVQFIRDKNSLVNDKDPIKTSSVSKIININKITYTEDQLDLLENSEILAIWALSKKKYNNRNYVMHWNTHHKNRKYPESKIISSIIIGFAVDRRDNMTFHWVTDLGQDISVLFDYADEVKSNAK